MTLPFAISFGAPLWFLALLSLPVLFGLYLLAERQRARAAAAFVAPHLIANVAPQRPGWRRHVPVALWALALAVLFTALAKPQKTVAVPVEQATIMLAIDGSGSMEATDVKPNRMAAARQAADRFLKQVPRRMQVGLVVFNQTPRVLQAPTTDRQSIRDALASVKPSGGTAAGEAIYSSLAAIRAVTKPGGKRPPAAIVLLTDGKSTHGRSDREAATAAKERRVPVHTIALGTPNGTIRRPQRDGTVRAVPVPPDPFALRRIAQLSGGRAFQARDSGSLSAVYSRLGSQVSKKKEKRQVTSAFAGGAIVLLVLGSLLSLKWFNRLA